MSAFSYEGETLRDGARHDVRAADHADAAARQVSAVKGAPNIFGNVDGAGHLSGVIDQAQADHARGAKATSADRNDQGERASSTAAQGDDLTVTTAQVANRATVSRVANGM